MLGTSRVWIVSLSWSFPVSSSPFFLTMYLFHWYKSLTPVVASLCSKWNTALAAAFITSLVSLHCRSFWMRIPSLIWLNAQSIYCMVMGGAFGLIKVSVWWYFLMVDVGSMLSILGLMHLSLGTCWSMPLPMSKFDQCHSGCFKAFCSQSMAIFSLVSSSNYSKS